MSLDQLLAAAPARGDLVVHGDVRLSTAALDHRVDRLAGGLVALGVERGDRVAFQLPVGIDAIVLYRACWRIGAVAVALHPAAGSHRLDASIAQATPALLVADLAMPLTDDPRAVDIADLDGPPPVAAASGPDDDALVMFTSGSTGSPKGVVHTHAGLRYKVEEHRRPRIHS